MKLRVAQIIGCLQIGGAERHFVNLANALTCDVDLAIFVSSHGDGPALYDQLDSGIVQLQSTVRKRTAPRDIWRLARSLKRSRINAVHTHMYWASLYGAIAARLAGVPLIVSTEHGENRWKKWHHRWVERHVISRLADHRFCVSEAILAQRRDIDGVPDEKLGLIANGTAVPAKPACPWSNKTPVIGSIGRFVHQKNFGLIVDGIFELRRQGRDVRCILVGDGPEMNKIQSRVSYLGLDSIISLPGADTDTDRWFRKFDIYASSSLEEGQPLSLLEAMSYGLPIVATDVGAVSSTLRNAVDGIVVPRSNVADFAAALSHFLDDHDLAKQYGQSARERVSRKFSIDVVAAQYEAFYQQLLARKQKLC